MIYETIIILHILAVIVAVGSVTVTDYLHLVSLKRRRLELQLKNIYPRLSNLINVSLIIIILTGVILFIMNSALAKSHLFLLKMALVAIVTINGIYLQRIVSPNLDLCILKGTKYCSSSVLYSTAISGSISIVTWYSIVILAFSKNFGYTINQFIISYAIILAIAITLSYMFEKRARSWRD